MIDIRANSLENHINPEKKNIWQHHTAPTIPSRQLDGLWSRLQTPETSKKIRAPIKYHAVARLYTFFPGHNLTSFHE